VQRRDGPPATTAMAYVDTLSLQLNQWASACASGGRPTVDGTEAARNIAVLDAIARSAAIAGAPVAVDYAGLF